MRNLICLLLASITLVSTASAASAQDWVRSDYRPHYGYGYNNYGRHDNLLAGLVVGAAVGYVVGSHNNNASTSTVESAPPTTSTQVVCTTTDGYHECHYETVTRQSVSALCQDGYNAHDWAIIHKYCPAS